MGLLQRIFFGYTLFFLMVLSTTVAGYGAILDKQHYSEVFQQQRDYRIFLPPAYAENRGQRFPVIYFFHGFGGRFNGPEEGEPSVTAESRYYDEFTDNIKRGGPDPKDNIAEFVKHNSVIVVKWDGYVAEQYPRPYDIGPVKQDLQFVDYFPELVAHIDKNYRTLAKREARASSGLSMGGFMSMFVASKYPHLIGSASFFNPSAGFFVGPKSQQVYVPFKHMGRSFIGLPIRQHIGSRDFLRQHNLELDAAFKQQNLFYESWHYGANYFKGFHTAVNIAGQFNFHLRNFRRPQLKPNPWYHIDPFPRFSIWGYEVSSDKVSPGFTLISHADKAGFTLQTQRWLPDGPPLSNLNFDVVTDAIYKPKERYIVRKLNLLDLRVDKRSLHSDREGRIRLELSGHGVDVGLSRPGGPGLISVPTFSLQPQFPAPGEEVEIRPVIFNKGNRKIKEVTVELMSLHADIEILDKEKRIKKVSAGAVQKNSAFRLRSRSESLTLGQVQFYVKYEKSEEVFKHQVAFYPLSKSFVRGDAKYFSIADGKGFLMDNGENKVFGEGNGNGLPEPGEYIAILARSEFPRDKAWYGLKLISNNPFLDREKERALWLLRPDWSGTARQVSEVYIRPNVPYGEEISLFGVYDFQKRGDLRRDGEGAHSFIHEKKRVKLRIKVGSDKVSSQ